MEGEKGRMPKMFSVGQARAQAHRELTTHELEGLSLAVCSNPVLKHFLHSRPSLAPLHVLPEALSTRKIILSSTSPLWVLPKLSCLFLV